jgi:transcriptional regulator with XRE-family HTH domain
MVLFRRLLGDVLRRHRQHQSRTLRDVAGSARISLGYLSEIERGRKEASSELLSSLCAALGISLADVLREVSDDIALLEGRTLARPVGFGAVGTTRAVAARPVAGVAPLVPGRVPSHSAPVGSSSPGGPVPVASGSPVAMLSAVPFVAA